jgi:hypothetical protein
MKYSGRAAPRRVEGHSAGNSAPVARRRACGAFLFMALGGSPGQHGHCEALSAECPVARFGDLEPFDFERLPPFAEHGFTRPTKHLVLRRNDAVAGRPSSCAARHATSRRDWLDHHACVRPRYGQQKFHRQPALATCHSARGGGSSRSSSAWLGRSQKDGLPSCPRRQLSGSRPSTRALERAA